MPVDRLEPLGTIQVIPELPINSRIVDRANEPHYTCPAGKKAIFKGHVVCGTTGAGATASLQSPDGTFNIATWQATGGSVDRIDSLQEGVPVNVELELEAGDTIETTQSSGTNAEFEVVGKIQESPA